jgi:hypothetical protein
MVQSNGTRWESQRFKIDFTGKKKYSGFSRELLRVWATGEAAARRAMPTSGARGVWSCGGGQSAVGPSRLPLHQPFAPWVRATASGCGSGLSGQKGRNCTAGCVTGRRRLARVAAVWGRTGDIAHLEPEEYFAFYSPCQVFSLLFRRWRTRAPGFSGIARNPTSGRSGQDMDGFAQALAPLLPALF